MRRRANLLMMHAYRFGNTSLAFESNDRTWLSHLDERYDAFRVERATDTFHVHFECTASERPPGLTSALSTFVEQPTIHGNARGFTATTATTFADVDLSSRRARVEGPRALYPVDNLFRHLLPALREQGALFHGAILAHGGDGVLACGSSGAGKSTLARLAGEHALCDELAAVCGSRLTSLPYWQARPGSVTLRAVVLLAHGRSHRLDRVTITDALQELTRHVLWPVELPRAMESTLGHVAEIADRAPVYQLAFRPEPDVWQFIREEVLS